MTSSTSPPDLADWFQPSYRVSRERLLESARRFESLHGAHVDSRAITERGPEGETLALDFAIFGARRPRHAMVVSSAVHGVEGFAGSAVQHWMIDQLLPRARLAGDTAVVIQHATNPWGFAWNRRVNESNVDLNRNFLDRFEPTQCSPEYEALYDALNPSDLDPESESPRLATMKRFIEEHGIRRFQQAVTEGQYKYPHGMQFGGHAQQPSTQHLLALVGEHLSHAETVLWLDVHSGLGEFADCSLITGACHDSEEHCHSRTIWGTAVESVTSGEAVATPLNGLMDRGLARALPPSCRLAVAIAEFGTYEAQRVFMAMRADNWLHRHGDLGDAKSRKMKAELLEVFGPADRAWRRQIVRTGAAHVMRAFEQLRGARLVD